MSNFSVSLLGDKGFEYATPFGTPKQAATLAANLGVGTCGVVAKLTTFTPTKKLGDLPLVPLIRELVDSGRGGELASVYVENGSFLPSPTLEFVQYAVGQELVDVINRLDSTLPGPASSCGFWGYWGYRVERADFGALLAHANKSLSPSDRLTQKQVGNKALFAKAAKALLPAHNGSDVTAHLSLAMVRHALEHKLESLTVEDAFHSLDAADVWQNVGEWAGDRFESPASDDHEMQFARGVVFTFAEQKRVALKAFLAAHALGDPRARRWLVMHGKVVAAVKKAAQKLPKKPEPNRVEANIVIEVTKLRRALATIKFDQDGHYKDPAKALGLVEALMSKGWFVGFQVHSLVSAARRMPKLPNSTRLAAVKLGERCVANALAAQPKAEAGDDVDDLPAAVALELAAIAATEGDTDRAFARLEDARRLGLDVAASGEEQAFISLREAPAYFQFFPTPEESAALRAVGELEVQVAAGNVRRFTDPARALKLLEPLAKRRWVATSLSRLICAALAPSTKAAVRAGVKRVATQFVDGNVALRGQRKRELGHTAHCLACLDATMGDAVQAIAHLRTARAMDSDISKAPKDPDFASLLTNPDFKALFIKS